MKSNSASIPLIWKSSLFYFVLAGVTGVLFRIGMVGGDVFGFSLQNIRHAHSHLMFFGWAGLLPFYIMFRYIKNINSGAKQWMKVSMISIVILSPITYLFFLFWGYHPVSIGDADLPLSAIFSSLVMIAWYIFIYGYWKVKPEVETEAQSWFTLALIMLGLSSLGAWGVGALQAFGLDNMLLAKAMTHFFLGTFTEGWVVVFIIGVLIKELELKAENFLISPDKLRLMILLGAPLTFSYGIPESLLTPELLWSAKIGGLSSSTAVILVIFASWDKCRGKKAIWFWPIVLLAVKAITQISASVISSEFWFSDHNLRILYLHILLLGAFTITGFGWLKITFNIKEIYFKMMIYSCLFVLVSLMLPTNLIPIGFKGVWIFYTMIIAACLPIISALFFKFQVYYKASNN